MHNRLLLEVVTMFSDETHPKINMKSIKIRVSYSLTIRSMQSPSTIKVSNNHHKYFYH